MLGRSPGFTVVCVVTLALGIGANSAIFSIVYNTLLRPLPFPDSNRLAVIWEVDASAGLTRGAASVAEFLDWRAQNDVFESMSLWRGWFHTLSGGEPEQVWGSSISADFFRVLGVKPLLGRDFRSDEETPGRDQVVLVTYSLWQRRYGADPALIGKSIAIDAKPYTVIGVLPPGFSLFGTSRQIDLWMPFAIDAGALNRDDHSVMVFARLKKGVRMSQAQSEMSAILRRLQQEYPKNDEGLGLRVSPMQQQATEDLRPALLLLVAAVAFVLFIACVNVANLLLARAGGREREVAIRVALGAGRRRIFNQLLTESILLGLIGGAFGLLVAYGGIRMLHVILPPEGRTELPRMGQIGIHPLVVAFAFAVSVFTGLLFGLAPAVQVSAGNLNETLKEGSRGTTKARHGKTLSSLLVVSEVALSLFLLIGAGLLIRSFARLMSEDIGFRATNLLTMQVWLPAAQYPDGAPVVNFFQQALARVRGLPGVQDATAANFLPMSGWYDFCNFDIDGREAPPPGKERSSQYAVVAAGYVRAMGLALKEGREFEPGDGPNTLRVALVNDSLARQFWPDQSPLGQRVRLHLAQSSGPWRPTNANDWATIVGVVGDIRDWTWNQQIPGAVYLLDSQSPSRLMRLVVRTSAPPGVMVPAIRHALVGLDPNQPVTEVHTMDQLVESAVARRRLSMVLLAIFAGFATLLAAIGIYGVMSYAVTQRGHEIGIRMALGAQQNHVVRMVVREGMQLAFAGVGAGVVASLLSVRLIRSLLYGVKPLDPITFAGVAALLAAVAFVSCYFPARRATKVDPIAALRHE